MVLWTEVEKAHPDVLELFFRFSTQGAGGMRGREIDFRTPSSSDHQRRHRPDVKLCADPETMPGRKDREGHQAGTEQGFQTRVPWGDWFIPPTTDPRMKC